MRPMALPGGSWRREAMGTGSPTRQASQKPSTASRAGASIPTSTRADPFLPSMSEKPMLQPHLLVLDGEIKPGRKTVTELLGALTWTKLHISYHLALFLPNRSLVSPPISLWCILAALPSCTDHGPPGGENPRDAKQRKRDTIWCPVSSSRIRRKTQGPYESKMPHSSRPSLHACGLFLLDSLASQ